MHYICKMAARSTTALHEAASRRHAEMVELLLQCKSFLLCGLLPSFIDRGTQGQQEGKEAGVCCRQGETGAVASERGLCGVEAGVHRVFCWKGGLKLCLRGRVFSCLCSLSRQEWLHCAPSIRHQPCITQLVHHAAATDSLNTPLPHLFSTLCVLDGANPFLGNSHGETPMELAVLAGAIKLVHIFERHALFVGQLEVQVSCEGQGKIGGGRWRLGEVEG